jgi:hypothetical protein
MAVEVATQNETQNSIWQHHVQRRVIIASWFCSRCQCLPIPVWLCQTLLLDATGPSRCLWGSQLFNQMIHHDHILQSMWGDVNIGINHECDCTWGGMYIDILIPPFTVGLRICWVFIFDIILFTLFTLWYLPSPIEDSGQCLRHASTDQKWWLSIAGR